MACKASAHLFLTTLAHTSNVGFDGCIANSSTFRAATLQVSGMPWPNYRRHSMKRMPAYCAISIDRTGNLPTDFFNVSPWLSVRSVSGNSQISSHLISRHVQRRHFTKTCARTIHCTQFSPRAPACSPLSMSKVPQLYNFRMFL